MIFLYHLPRYFLSLPKSKQENMKKLLSCGLMLLLTAIRCVTAFAANSFVDFESGDWQLNTGDRVTIYVAPDDERGVARAARDLKKDLETVCGAQVIMADSPDGATIVIGTVGHSKAVKAMEKQLKGKHEMYLLDARQGQLVIAGSDRRGTIYGIYELSRQLGVSPWYWWADAPIERHASVYVKNGTYTEA
jgi:hypothetical protein